MIRLLTRLFIALLFIISNLTEAGVDTVFAKEEFVLAIVKSPVGSYYGNPYIRYLTDHLGTDGVHAVYIKPTIAKTKIPSNYQISLIAGKIVNTAPKQVLADSSIIKRLKTELPVIWHSRLKPFSFEDVESSYVEQYAIKLRNFLAASNFIYDKVYILHDQTPFSTERALRVKNDLQKAKFPSLKLKLVAIKNYHSIGAELRKISDKPPSIIINSIYVVNDVEVNKLKYGDDAKKSILANNRKHLDIGFWQARYNEALIIEPNPKQFYDHFIMGKSKTITVNLLVNKDRLNSLKLRHLYINGVNELDGLIAQ